MPYGKKRGAGGTGSRPRACNSRQKPAAAEPVRRTRSRGQQAIDEKPARKRIKREPSLELGSFPPVSYAVNTKPSVGDGPENSCENTSSPLSSPSPSPKDKGNLTSGTSRQEALSPNEHSVISLAPEASRQPESAPGGEKTPEQQEHAERSSPGLQLLIEQSAHQVSDLIPYKDGYTAGHAAGFRAGLEAATSASLNTGHAAGFNAGHVAGFNAGIVAGRQRCEDLGHLSATASPSTHSLESESETSGVDDTTDDEDDDETPAHTPPKNGIFARTRYRRMSRCI